MIVIDNLLAGVRAAETKIVDLDAELKYIADWLEKPKYAENIDCVFDEECTMFTYVKEFDDMGQQEILTPLHNRSINVEFYYELLLQPSFRMKGSRNKIKLGSTTRYEGFKFSSKKHKKTNKYHLTARKVKMK